MAAMRDGSTSTAPDGAASGVSDGATITPGDGASSRPGDGAAPGAKERRRDEETDNTPPRMLQSSGIDVGYQPNIEAAWFRIQRVTWMIMGALLVAGLLGVFGRGPLANAVAQTPDGAASVSYERFTRFRTPTRTIVHIDNPDPLRPLHVFISTSLLRAIPVQSMVPTPLAQRPVANGTEFDFGPVTTGPLDILISQQAGSIGPASGQVQLPGEPPVDVASFVYP